MCILPPPAEESQDPKTKLKKLVLPAACLTTTALTVLVARTIHVRDEKTIEFMRDQLAQELSVLDKVQEFLIDKKLDQEFFTKYQIDLES